MAIIRRGGKYGVRVYDRRAQGQRWVGTFDRLKDAKRAEADATDTQRPVATRTLTVARWVERWLKGLRAPVAGDAPHIQLRDWPDSRRSGRRAAGGSGPSAGPRTRLPMAERDDEGGPDDVR